MASYDTKVSSQGQVSVPAEIRKKLEVQPGAVLEWVDDGDTVVVRRKREMSWEVLHSVLFPDGLPRRRSLEEMKAGVARAVKERHARGRY